MSSPALKFKPPAARRRQLPAHIHLPSIHVRSRGGSAGYDYEEDIFIHRGRGARLVERIVRLVAMESGVIALMRETRDILCAEEWAQLQESLPILMDPENPAATAAMEECARAEFARQRRIANGEEQTCANCGCSETRACSGGCVWASPTLCSRCL